MAWSVNSSKYVTDLLTKLGDPNTSGNRQALMAWAQAEGGSAGFNPFNTTQGAGGASDYNSVGVKSYSNYQSGLNATVQTLTNGRYKNILQALHSGKSSMQVAQAIEHSPWGTGGGVLKVLQSWGAKIPPPVPGQSGGTTANGGKIVKAGPQVSTKFNADLFKKQTAALMIQNAQALTSGGDPASAESDLLSGLVAARKAATTKVLTSSGMPASGPHMASGGPLGSGIGGTAVKLASKQLGVPYVWGGEAAGKGFDCSGLVQYVYKQMGVDLPRTAAEQGKMGSAVDYHNLKPGDILVENNGDHVVLYAGNGKVIEAPHTGDKVKYAPLSWFPADQYFARRIVGGKKKK